MVQIDVRELLGMLREATRAPDALLEYIQVEDLGGSIDPVAGARPESVARWQMYRRRLPMLLNTYSRRYRERRYRRQIAAGYAGLRIVSEGDSWFQYPFLLRDVIDHLSERYAVLSLGKAGDTLSNIIAEQSKDIFPALAEHRPHCFLISGGGNDMVGNGRLAQLVPAYRPGMSAAAYAHTPAFDDFISELVGSYGQLFEDIHARHPGLHILLHGYDAPIPRETKDPWLGEPLRAQGILDPELQRSIMIAIMDRYNAELAQFAAGNPYVHHVNCRGCLVPRHWYDAMHPTDVGYARVADLFDGRLRELADAQGLPLDLPG